MRMSNLYQAAKPTSGPHRFDVSKLAGLSLDENGENTQRGHFQELASKYASEQWKAEGTIGEKWVAIRSTLTQAAKTALGVERRKHPDWFRENIDSLEPILQKRNELYLRWLGSGLSSDKQRFAQAKSKAR